MLIQELLPRGTLAEVLARTFAESEPLHWEALQSLASGLASGLAYLHESRPPIPAMLSAHSVLVADGFQPKIRCGLALADGKAQGVTTKAAVPPDLWSAPEIIRGEPPSPASDVFTLGIILCEIFSNKEVYFRQRQTQSVDSIVMAVSLADLRPDFSELCPQAVRELVSDTWIRNPSKRPPIREVVSALEAAIQASHGFMASAGQHIVADRQRRLRKASCCVPRLLTCARTQTRVDAHTRPTLHFPHARPPCRRRC